MSQENKALAHEITSLVGPTLVTTTGFAAALGVTVTSLYLWKRKDKDFPPGARIGKRRVWKKSDVQAYIARRLGGPQEPHVTPGETP